MTRDEAQKDDEPEMVIIRDLGRTGITMGTLVDPAPYKDRYRPARKQRASDSLRLPRRRRGFFGWPKRD